MRIGRIFFRQPRINNKHFTRRKQQNFSRFENVKFVTVKNRHWFVAGIGVATAIFTASFIAFSESDITQKSEIEAEQMEEEAENFEIDNLKEFESLAGVHKEGLPSYNRDQVKEHRNKEDRIWVSFRDGVYDITDFLELHPGGNRILLGAGGALEPFWAMYAVHKHPEVAEILERYRIGNLIHEEGDIDFNDPYATDPPRHPALKVNAAKPFNAETPLAILGDNFITANDLFYVRNHLPVPVVDEDTHKIQVSGEGMKTIELDMDELKIKFEQHKVVAAIQCAGNRRSQMAEIRPVQGLSWGVAAIGNAVWEGPKLRDVLIYAGYDLTKKDPNQQNIEHVQFEGLDRDFEKFYGASIPASQAIRDDADVILALKMNGEPLPPDHGFPIRMVVPGTVGARNVKWLCKIHASSQESQSHWQQKDYKGFGPNVDWANIDYSQAPAIQDLPVTSAIIQPANGTTINKKDQEEMEVTGYAWSGGGRGIVRVDVSTDGGETWEQAKLIRPIKQPYAHSWAWTLWKHNVKIPKDKTNFQLVCKAVDTSYNVQPESFAPVWNIRGVLATAYHRVNIKVVDE